MRSANGRDWTTFELLLQSLEIPPDRMFPLDPAETEGAPDWLNDRPAFIEHGSVPELAPRLFVGAVAVLGAGYIGLSLVSAIAAVGYDVVATERHPGKRLALERGQSHLAEPGVPELIAAVTDDHRLVVTDDISLHLARIRLAVVCLGPMLSESSEKDGQPPLPQRTRDGWDTFKFKRILAELGQAIVKNPQPTPLNVVIAGTIRPQDFQLAIDAELRALLTPRHMLIDLVGDLANMTDLGCRVQRLV